MSYTDSDQPCYDIVSKTGIRTRPYLEYVTAQVRNQEGNMPFSLLTSKFEQTNMDVDVDDMSKDFQRECLMDRTNIGQSRFEWEGLNDNAAEKKYGKLNLFYGGYRGNRDINDVYIPDVNLYDLEKDDRGIATDPDLHKVNDQSYARGGFKRMYNDDKDMMTRGESRSEPRMIADLKKQQEFNRRLMKIFSPERVNLTPGGWAVRKLPDWMKLSCNDQYVGDCNNSLVGGSKILLADSVRFALEHADDSLQQDFDVMKYNNKTGKSTVKETMSNMKGHVMNQQNNTDEDETLHYTSLAIAISQIIKAVQTQTEFEESNGIKIRSTKLIDQHKSVINMIADQMNKTESISPILFGTKKPDAHIQVKKMVENNQQLADTVASLLMYNAAVNKSDPSKIIKQIAEDIDYKDNIHTVLFKLAKKNLIPVSKSQKLSDITIESDGMQVMNYKNITPSKGRSANNRHDIVLKKDADNNIMYRTNTIRPELKTTRDESDMYEQNEMFTDGPDMNNNHWITRSFDQLPNIKKYRIHKRTWDNSSSN